MPKQRKFDWILLSSDEQGRQQFVRVKIGGLRGRRLRRLLSNQMSRRRTRQRNTASGQKLRGRASRFGARLPLRPNLISSVHVFLRRVAQIEEDNSDERMPDPPIAVCELNAAEVRHLRKLIRRDQVIREAYDNDELEYRPRLEHPPVYTILIPLSELRVQAMEAARLRERNSQISRQSSHESQDTNESS